MLTLRLLDERQLAPQHLDLHHDVSLEELVEVQLHGRMLGVNFGRFPVRSVVTLELDPADLVSQRNQRDMHVNEVAVIALELVEVLSSFVSGEGLKSDSYDKDEECEGQEGPPARLLEPGFVGMPSGGWVRHLGKLWTRRVRVKSCLFAPDSSVGFETPGEERGPAPVSVDGGHEVCLVSELQTAGVGPEVLHHLGD